MSVPPGAAEQHWPGRNDPLAGVHIDYTHPASFYSRLIAAHCSRRRHGLCTLAIDSITAGINTAIAEI
jgi:hypothetical protein